MRNDIFLKQIGAKIKAARKANKLSLERLSELSGIDMSNIWFIEKGQRNVHILTLKAIADVLKAEVKDFI